MKENMLRYWPIITIIIITAGSCAKQANPAGGPKDTEPPKIVKSIPLNSTINYKGKSIAVTFDEYVVLDKINEKFMVSPPMNIKPKIYVRGKSLMVEFQEELKDSTTYTFYFQDAIRDLNERNPLNNFQFVFSTGKIIDSLSVTGNVLDSYTLETEKNTLVLMYRNTADSAPKKILPDYLTQADINGGFRINNVKEGKYKIYALQDNNNNKKYDPADEAFAFIDSVADIIPARNFLPEPKTVDTIKPKNKKATVIPLKDKKATVVPLINGEYKLFMFTAAKKAHYLSSSGRKLPYLLTYTLSIPPDTSKFEFSIPDYKEKDYLIEKNPAQDTIMIWLRDSSLYSKPQINSIIKYPFTDSTGTIVYKRDTVPMRFLASRTSKAREATSIYKYSTNMLNNMLKPGQQIIFSSQTPFMQPYTSRIKLYESATTAKIDIPFALIMDSSNSRKYYLKAKLKEGGKYTLITDSAAFGDIYGEVSDSTGINFSVNTTNSYGRLTINIQNGTGDLIIQLLGDKEKLIAEKKLKNEKSAEFPMLEKGNYRFRVIYDLNGDGKWTTGDFDKKRQPEPVSYYPDEIEIKIDWEVQQDWDVGIKNFKNQKLKTKVEQNR